jgi:type II secretory pathway component PulF
MTPPESFTTASSSSGSTDAIREFSDKTRSLGPGRRSDGLLAGFRPFVTNRLRQESNGLLARELLFALRHALPLAEALDAFTRPDTRVSRTFWNALVFGTLFLALLAWAAIGGGGGVFVLGFAVLLVILLGASAQSDDYRRHVGVILARELRRGNALGEAFRRHPDLFGPFETTLVRVGERSGRLGPALEAWTRHTASTERLSHTADMAIYPLLVACVLLMGLAFVGTLIIPRFSNIWTQLYGPPVDTGSVAIVFKAMRLTRSTAGSILILPALLVAGFFLLAVLPRRFFNGSVQGSLIYLALAMAAFHFFFWIGVALFSRGGLFGFRFFPEELRTTFVAAVSIPLSFLYVWGAFHFARWSAGRGSDRFLALLSFLPLMRSASRRLDESRFLLALEALLQSGREWPEAFAEAGEAVGKPRWSRAGREAAALARQGRSPAELFRSLRLLHPFTRVRLTVAEFDRALLPALRETADESHRIGARNLTRFNAIFFPLLHLGTATLVGFYLVLFYIPIFYLTRAIPYSG